MHAETHRRTRSYAAAAVSVCRPCACLNRCVFYKLYDPIRVLGLHNGRLALTIVAAVAAVAADNTYTLDAKSSNKK